MPDLNLLIALLRKIELMAKENADHIAVLEERTIDIESRVQEIEEDRDEC